MPDPEYIGPVDIIYLGPSSTLYFTDGGDPHYPGEVMTVDADVLGNLTRNGERFSHAHSEEEFDIIAAGIE